MKCPVCSEKIDLLSAQRGERQVIICSNCSARLLLNWEARLIRSVVVFFFVSTVVGFLFDNAYVLSIVVISSIVIMLKYIFRLDMDENAEESESKE
jgi:DNA-directed RNA polymerase subunit RPC12/RpoP